MAVLLVLVLLVLTVLVVVGSIAVWLVMLHAAARIPKGGRGRDSDTRGRSGRRRQRRYGLHGCCSNRWRRCDCYSKAVLCLATAVSMQHVSVAVWRLLCVVLCGASSCSVVRHMSWCMGKVLMVVVMVVVVIRVVVVLLGLVGTAWWQMQLRMVAMVGRGWWWGKRLRQ